MSLRTRLIVAFFTLSVVPLAAVTFYAYTSNVRALREAAEHEADLLAGELGQRMQLVTAQLSERVEHLMDVAELQSAVERASAPKPAAVPPVPPVSEAELIGTTVANALGEAAMLLNNVELQGWSGGRQDDRLGPALKRRVRARPAVARDNKRLRRGPVRVGAPVLAQGPDRVRREAIVRRRRTILRRRRRHPRRLFRLRLRRLQVCHRRRRRRRVSFRHRESAESARRRRLHCPRHRNRRTPCGKQ